MKKLAVICLLALVLATPSMASAQAITQEEINAQLQVLLNQLLVQVQDLMTKLIAMQAQQVADSQVLGAVQSTVQVMNSQPRVIAPTPIPTLAPAKVWKQLEQDNPYPTATPQMEGWARVVNNYGNKQGVIDENTCDVWRERVLKYNDPYEKAYLEGCEAALNALHVLNQ